MDEPYQVCLGFDESMFSSFDPNTKNTEDNAIKYFGDFLIKFCDE